MKCEQYQEQISPYLDDALSHDEKLQLEAHLKTCPACEETFNMMRLMIGSLSEFEDEALPAGFHEALHERLLKEQVSVPMNKKAKRSYHWIPYVSGLVAAVIIAFIVLPEGSQVLKDEATVAPPPPAAMPQTTNTRMQAESYSLESAAEGIPMEEAKVSDAQPIPQVQMVNNATDKTTNVITDVEEEWTITPMSQETLASFINAYCDAQKVSFTTWEESGMTHYALDLTSKEDFKAQLTAQLGSEQALTVTAAEDTNRVHLIVQ